ADIEILDVTAFLDHFAGNLVSEHHAGRRRRATPDHVLVGAADVRRHDLENDAVIDRLSGWIAKGRKVDLLNLNAAGFEVNHATIGSIGSHLSSPTGLPTGARTARLNVVELAKDCFRLLAEGCPALRQSFLAFAP